tara:strand:+ start:6928 stop:7626 length:699 start_codon:yes stop_codon:yes gene_type:complete
MAVTREILNSHPATTLKKEIAKTNIKGYSKMKKAELVEVMMKNKEKFGHIQKAGKKVLKPPKELAKSVKPESKPKKTKEERDKRIKEIEEKQKKRKAKKEESTISDETALGMMKEIREEISDSYDSLDQDLPEDFKKLRDKFEENVPYRGGGRFDKKSKGKMEFDNLKLEMAKAIKPTAKSTSKNLEVLLKEVKKKGLLEGELLKKWNNWKKAINKAYKEIEPEFVVTGKFK